MELNLSNFNELSIPEIQLLNGGVSFTEFCKSVCMGSTSVVGGYYGEKIGKVIGGTAGGPVGLVIGGAVGGGVGYLIGCLFD